MKQRTITSIRILVVMVLSTLSASCTKQKAASEDLYHAVDGL